MLRPAPQASRPRLRVAFSRDDARPVGAPTELRAAIAETAADVVGRDHALQGTPVALGTIVNYLLGRGLTCPGTIGDIVSKTSASLAAREAAAIKRYRRPKPPRRPRSRVPRAVQLMLPFAELGRAA